VTERDFELIDVLYKTGNITKAADKLYMTQSALSKRIRFIEEELGITMILRSHQGIRFTPEGESVLLSTGQAKKILSDLRQQLNGQKNYISGTLNAGISINYSLYRLPDMLAHYRHQYPHVKTHILSGHSRDLYTQMVNGELDAAVLRGEFLWTEHKILIDREDVCIIMNQKFEQQPLNDIPYIGRRTDAVFERETSQWFHENKIQTDADGIFVDNITTCVEMVKSGLGWSIVPRICLNNFNGIIRPLHFANGEPFVRSTYLMYPDTALKLPQVSAFIGIIKKGSSYAGV
jgi:DNA-binding transcriptional LysR family regulator